MLTDKDYCDYETCVALKELGYIGSPYECECFGAYFNLGKDIFTDSLDNTEVGADEFLRVPLYLAQKWLREEKRICVEVDCCAGGYVWELCKAHHKDWFSGGTTIYTHCCEDNAINPLLNDCGKYDSYEEALLEGVREAIKLLKEEK